MKLYIQSPSNSPPFIDSPGNTEQTREEKERIQKGTTMANKFVAVFLMCIVVAAALHFPTAEAGVEDSYKTCFGSCSQECKTDGHGSTFCEMKCDTDCTNKENDEKLQLDLH